MDWSAKQNVGLKIKRIFSAFFWRIFSKTLVLASNTVGGIFFCQPPERGTVCIILRGDLVYPSLRISLWTSLIRLLPMAVCFVHTRIHNVIHIFHPLSIKNCPHFLHCKPHHWLLLLNFNLIQKVIPKNKK